MSARSWWSAKADQKPAEKRDNRSGEGRDLPVNDILDARIDDGGRLAQLGKDQRVAEHLEPRPPAASIDELDLAVQKLSEGLEAIERQSRARSAPTVRSSTVDVPAAGSADADGGRDFVTYSLDRLEARLEALSRRLQQRAGSDAPARAAAEPVRPPIASRAEPAPRTEASPAVTPDDDLAAQLAASRRLAELEEARQAERDAAREESARQNEAAGRARREAEQAQREAEQARREAEQARREAELVAEEERRRQARIAEEIAEARREVEEAEARRRSELAEARRQTELAEAKRQAEVIEARRRAEVADARRQAEVAEARRQAEMAEARLHEEAEAAEEERRREAEQAEAIRLADLAAARRNAEAAEMRHRAEVEEARRQAELAAARRDAEMAAQLERQISMIEGRIDGLQRGLDENQVEPVRGELLELVQQIADLSRGGRATSEGLAQIGIRLDQMEVKLNAARNMAGNRLGDIQDRLVGVVERIDEIEGEIPAFDAIRVKQDAVLERFDRMEGLVHRLGSQEELFERIDALKRQVQTNATQREVERVEQEILRLALRLDALPEEVSDRHVLAHIEEQLGGLAADLTEARRQRKSVATELEDHLAEVSAQLRDVAETARAPDLSGFETRLASLSAQMADDRVTSSDMLARLERRLGGLTDAIENQEDETTKALLGGLTQKVDSLSASIDAQDSRQDIEGLGRKLDEFGAQLSAQAEHVSRRQIEPIGERLVAIEDRITALSNRATDPRALQAQVEGIISRLELLKGRSIDPTRLNDLFDRVDSAMRALPEERLDRLEEKLDQARAPVERFDRLEMKIAEAASGGATADRLSRLEKKLDEVVRVFSAGSEHLTQEDLTELRAEILELLKGRSIDQTRLNDLFDRVDAAMRALPEERFDRLEEKLDQAKTPVERFDRLEKKIAEAAAGVATTDRLSRLEKKLDEVVRVFSAGSELLTQEDLADLRSEIVSLRRELRSAPGQGETNLGELMRTLVKRLEHLPQGTPATVADLETHIGSIAKILEETRRAFDRAGAEGNSRGALAESLTADVSGLKNSTEASERKTREAIDAVQDTLEAVVKRMAFLERDAGPGAVAGDRRPVEAPKLPDVAPAKASKLPDAAPAKAPAPALASEPAEPAEPSSPSLLSRLTSRQLLRRATGGRAESFSPEPEESDDSSDIPLEPGTDAPLHSALAGAPSSNTEFMSGARKGRLNQAFVDDERPRALIRPETAPAIDDDFLAAARRAARAAAQEAVATHGDGPVERSARGLAGAVRAHRRAIIAAAIAAAIIIAALPLLRQEEWPDWLPGSSNVASVPQDEVIPADQPESVAAPEASTPGEPQPETASAPDVPIQAPPAAETAGAPEAASPEQTPPQEQAAVSPESSAPESDSATANMSSSPENATSPATAGASPATQGQSATGQPPAPQTSIASVEPQTTTEANSGAATPPIGEAQTPVPPLPESIGSTKLREAAMSGDTAAAFEVASRYAEGRGVLPDMPTAVAWYERAAEAGLAPAQYRLGSIYEKGLGVAKDPSKAQLWYTRAADAGNVKAMHNLAVLHAEGAGGTPDLEKASGLFRKAAERGVRDSQFNLAILHARGLGVPQDLVEAYKWFGIAASSGDEESAKRRDIIGAALSADDKARAEQAIAMFQPVPLASEANEVQIPQGGWQDSDNSTSINMSDQNELVALVQKLLAQNGYDPGPPDGLLGKQTIDAIAAFQAKAGLPRTGQIDTGLVAALQGNST